MMHYKSILSFFLLVICMGIAACGPNARELNESGIEKLKNEDFKGALEDFTKAIERDPELAEAYLHRGYVYGNKGELQEALADFNQAIAIDSAYIEAYYNRGFIYHFFEDYHKAGADFDKVIELNPEDTEAYVIRAMNHARLNDSEGELADLKTAARLGDPTARSWLEENEISWGDGNEKQDKNNKAGEKKTK